MKNSQKYLSKLSSCWHRSLGFALCVFTRAQSKQKILGSYQDIIDNKLSVCIVKGYTYSKSFWQNFSYKKALQEGLKVDPKKYAPDRRDYHPLLVPSNSPETCFRLLAKQRVDKVISDLSIGLYEIKKLPENAYFNVKQADIVNYEATLFSKGYPLPWIENSIYPGLVNVAQRFWKGLKVMQENGEYQVIVDKWLK